MPSWMSLGPLSYQGAPPSQKIQGAALPDLRLTVVTADSAREPLGHAYVNPKSVHTWQEALAPPCFVCLTSGSDCILTLRLSDDVAEGSLHLDSVQQHNLHVAPGELYSFSLFTPPRGEKFDLAELEAEVRLMVTNDDESEDEGTDGSAPTHAQLPEVDASLLTQQLSKQWFGRIVAVNQLIPLRLGDLRLLVRVAATETLAGEERAQALGYHCFRGLLTADTQVYLSEAQGSKQPEEEEGKPRPTHLQRSIRLVNIRERLQLGTSRHMIQVETNDGEVFPIARTLLRPCIALTKVVRNQEATSVAVDIDTATFDRVLIFLEAEALGRPLPGFAAHLLEDLLRAAAILGLRTLQDECQQRLGEMESRVRRYTFDEIRQKNEAGECWLLLNGMVLDVTRWLPEHPGGSTIIPAQALNLDCSRFYEVYHSSRESFLYIKQFYMGELQADDLERVPCPQLPSDEFLQHLKEYTAAFRLPNVEEPKMFKSF